MLISFGDMEAMYVSNLLLVLIAFLLFALLVAMLYYFYQNQQNLVQNRIDQLVNDNREHNQRLLMVDRRIHEREVMFRERQRMDGFPPADIFLPALVNLAIGGLMRGFRYPNVMELLRH